MATPVFKVDKVSNDAVDHPSYIARASQEDLRGFFAFPVFTDQGIQAASRMLADSILVNLC